jgi:erythritol/L-threitol dehydrogenase
MADYMVYNKDALVYKISSELPPAHAAFTEPLSCALHAVERAGIKFEDVVVVAGCGPIGLGMIAGARSKNPKAVVALDMAQEKLDIAKECGADVIVNIGQEDPVARVKEMTDGYGASQAGHVCRVQRLRQRRKR